MLLSFDASRAALAVVSIFKPAAVTVSVAHCRWHCNSSKIYAQAAHLQCLDCVLLSKNLENDSNHWGNKVTMREATSSVSERTWASHTLLELAILRTLNCNGFVLTCVKGDWWSTYASRARECCDNPHVDATIPWWHWRKWQQSRVFWQVAAVWHAIIALLSCGSEDLGLPCRAKKSMTCRTYMQ